MEKQTFKIIIDAPREKVWELLWNDDSYREWASVFSPGSRAESDWNEGSKILFLNAENEGMVSAIETKKTNSFMAFKHLGLIQKGVEDRESDKVQQWAGARETYSLKDANGQTELTIELDVTDEFKDYMADTWPKALAKLKTMVEKETRDLAMDAS